MQIIIFVLEVIFLFFLWSRQLFSALLWVLSISMFYMSFEFGNERIYLEVIDDYPIQDLIKPRRFKFFYKKLNKLSDKDIPKEMYYSETIKVYEVVATFAEKPNNDILPRLREILLGDSHIRQSDTPDIKLKKNIKEAV